jgi:hypothetical protein
MIPWTAKIRRTALALAVFGCWMAGSAPAQEEGRPEYFRLGPRGDLTCVGITEDACAYYDIIRLRGGSELYLVQGSFSRKAKPADKHYTNVYFASLCRRDGDALRPFFDVLEGRERVSDIHLRDLTRDRVPEIIVTAAFDSRESYAKVYRVDTGTPVQIFTHRANTAGTDFEMRGRTPSLIFEQLDAMSAPVRREVYAWNGREFVLKS